MKAAEWYAKLKAAETDEDLERVLVNCLKSLVEDADKLIKIRKATSNEAIAGCIRDVNNKWIAIINCKAKDKNIDSGSPISKAEFVDDGFKAAYVHIHPKRGWMFDLKQHKKRVERLQADHDRKQLKDEGLDITNPTLILHGLTPYTKITEYDCSLFQKEMLGGLYTLSKINSSGLPTGAKYIHMKIVADYISHLKVWLAIEKYDPAIIEMDIKDITPYIYKTYGVVVNLP